MSAGRGSRGRARSLVPALAHATVGRVAPAALAVAASALVPAPGAGQIYLEPQPGLARVTIDARRLADPDAARALGIPLVDDLPALSHGRLHVEGARAALVVLGRFSDSPAPAVSADVVRERMFTSTAGATLADFYEDQSGGVFTVTGDVLEWRQTNVTLLDAAGSVNGHGLTGDSLSVHVGRLLQAVDADVDFAQFDNDGPDGIPGSGDDDGRVDFLSIKYAEVGGHCGGPGPWPHFGAVRVNGEPFVSNEGIEAPVYIMDSVVECDGTTPQGIAVTAHELGHAIGLPDYYRAVAGIEAENRHWAVGCFDLMGAGGWGCGGGPLPTSGFGPTGFSAYSRWVLGWAELEEITLADDETFVLEPLATSARALRVRLAPQSLESWIIEYRTRAGFDAPLPDEGVLIYHRDDFSGPRAVDPALPPPYSYHLVEADGDDGLRRIASESGNRGVETDLFARTGPSGPLGPATTPSTRDHLGGQSTLVVHEITRPGATATVRLTVGTGLRVAFRSLPSSPTVLEPYVGVIEIEGGQGPYAIAEQLGELPADLAVTLDGTTVSVLGMPRAAGAFGTTVRIGDAAGTEIAEAISVQVMDHPAVNATGILGAVIGAGGLGADVMDYLDRSGNDDDELDVGDLRAFLRRTGG